MIAFALLSAGLMAYAQDDIYFKSDHSERKGTGETFIPLNDKGAYERQEVVTVEGASASSLYDLAMMALSDWTGPDGKAKVGIDYQNQETHTVVYKGTFSLGFKNIFLGDGWNRYANFTLKVRCKDGRAQVVVTVAQMTGIYNRENVERSCTIAEMKEAVMKSKGAKRERGETLLAYIVETADGMISEMTEKLKATTADGDEDF